MRYLKLFIVQYNNKSEYSTYQIITIQLCYQLGLGYYHHCQFLFFIHRTVQQQHSISSNTKSLFVTSNVKSIHNIYKRDNYSICIIDVHTIVSKGQA